MPITIIAFTPMNQRRTSKTTHMGVTDSVHAHEVVPVRCLDTRSINLRILVRNHIIKVTGGSHHIITLCAVCSMTDPNNDVVMPSTGTNKRKRVECPLCSGLDVMVEHAGATPGDNQAI